MIAHNSNEGSRHIGVVWFIWYAADCARTLGQLVAIDYSDSTPDVAYTYDRLGWQLTVTDVLGTRTNVYSPTALLEERHPDGTALVRSYDTYGRASGIALGSDYAVSYGYDEYGRFSTVAVSNGPTFTYTYLPGTSLLVGYTNTLGLSVAYAYEPHRDVKTLVSNAWGTNVISTFAYTYDAIGRRTQRIDDGITTNLFGYNLRSELTSAEMGTNVYSYAYDPIGNRTSASENGLTNLYAANELNQYTALNPASPNPTPFTYDPDGNMTQYGDLSFYWDAENRLIGVTSNGTFLVTNRYDFMSRRVEKATSTETNAFVYDEWNLLCETVGSASATTTNHYVWGLDLSGTLQGAGGIGGLLVQRHSENTFPWFSFCDINGNITDLLDEFGILSAHYEYDSYGKTTVQSGDCAEDNSFKFSTKYFDGETELYDYGYRFVSLKSGCWLSRDPINERGGLNMYSFVRNAPVLFTDKLGLQFNCKEYNRHIYLAGGVLGAATVIIDYTIEKCDCCKDGEIVRNGYIDAKNVAFTLGVSVGAGFVYDFGAWTIPEPVPFVGGQTVHLNFGGIISGPGIYDTVSGSGLFDKCNAEDNSNSMTMCLKTTLNPGIDSLGVGALGTGIFVDASVRFNFTSCLTLSSSGINVKGGINLAGGMRVYGELFGMGESTFYDESISEELWNFDSDVSSF